MPLLFKKNYLDTGDNCTFTVLLLCDFCVPLWFFGGDRRTNPRVLLNEVSVQPRVLPASAGNRERGMQLIPQIKLTAKNNQKQLHE